MDIIEFIILLSVLGYSLLFFCHLVLKSLKAEIQQKRYFIGVAVFSIGFFVTRFFLLMNDLIYPETMELSLRQGILYLLASFFAMVALFWLMYVVERFVSSTLHYIPSIIILSSAVLIIILPKTADGMSLVTIYTVVSGASASLIPILYLKVGFQVSGKTRKKSFLLAFGIVFLLIGNLINMGLLRKSFPILVYLSPLSILIGLVIFHFALLIYQVN
jgi:hypothetical protein